MIYNLTNIMYVSSFLILLTLVFLLQYGNIKNFLYKDNFKHTIIAYYGNEPPHGWVLCDGKLIDGIQIPDLREKFVLGGSTYSQIKLQQYLINMKSFLDIKDITDKELLDVLQIQSVDQYITDSTTEIRGGNNLQTLTTPIFDKTIIKNNLQQKKQQLESADISTTNIDDRIKNLTNITNSQITSHSIENNNSHSVDIMSKDISLDNTHFDIDSSVITEEFRPYISDNIETDIDTVQNNTNYDDIKTNTSNDIGESEYMNWMNDKLGNLNEITDTNNIWKIFTESEYDSDYINNFNLNNFLKNINDDNTLTEEEKANYIIKINFVYNPGTFTKTIDDMKVVPEYNNYKFPSTKTITADNNLPPYFSLIYIMKL